MKPARLVAAAGAALLGLTTLVVVAPLTTPAQASPDAPTAACPPGQVAQQRPMRGPSGKQITITVCVPGESTPGEPPPGEPDEEDSGNPDENDGNYTICVPWSEAYPGHDPSLLTPGGPGEEAYRCIRYIDGAPILGPYLPTWLGPSEDPPPTPDEVAADIWASVEGNLLDPHAVADPAIGMPALLTVPTFVSVDNWQPGFTEEDCDDSGTVCVALTATPALTFDPGDGSDPIACEDGGTVYDPAGGSPREQAQGGACAHAYEQRTGTDGRPDAWEAVVTITWSVTWEQPSTGIDGVIPDIALSDGFSREVEEVQSVGRDPDD